MSMKSKYIALALVLLIASLGGVAAASERRIYYAESARIGFHPPWPQQLKLKSKVRVTYWYAPAHFTPILPLEEVRGVVADFGMNDDSTIWIDGKPENRVSMFIDTGASEVEIFKPRIHEIFLQD